MAVLTKGEGGKGGEEDEEEQKKREGQEARKSRIGLRHGSDKSKKERTAR
jgi:hypothetical protein